MEGGFIIWVTCKSPGHKCPVCSEGKDHTSCTSCIFGILGSARASCSTGAVGLLKPPARSHWRTWHTGIEESSSKCKSACSCKSTPARRQSQISPPKSKGCNHHTQYRRTAGHDCQYPVDLKKHSIKQEVKRATWRRHGQQRRIIERILVTMLVPAGVVTIIAANWQWGCSRG